MIVRRDFLEAQIGVERAGGFHAVERVQQHAGVVGEAGGVEDAFRQRAAQAKAAKRLAHVEALHLGGVGVVGGVQRPQGAAAREAAIDVGEHDLATRRGVFAGQGGEFFFEILKRQVDVERSCVLAEDVTHHFHLVGLRGNGQGYGGWVVVHGQSGAQGWSMHGGTSGQPSICAQNNDGPV